MKHSATVRNSNRRNVNLRPNACIEVFHTAIVKSTESDSYRPYNIKFHYQKGKQNYNTKKFVNLLENTAKFIHVGMTIRNENKILKEIREILRTIRSESFTSTFATGISSKMQESSTHIIGRTKTEDIRKQDAEE